IFDGDVTRHQFEAEEAKVFGTKAKKTHRVDFEMDFAFQGQEALACVQATMKTGRRYAMVFMDVRMPPGWDGLETTLKLWEVDPDLQIVICTAYSDYSWDEMMKVIGSPERLLILKKPFDTIEVVQFAHALTEKWSLLQGSRYNTAMLESVVNDRTHELQGINALLESEIAVRKAAEEGAQESEREQRELAAQLGIERARLVAAQAVARLGSWEIDLSTHAVIWSDETYRIFETDPDQFQPTHQDFLQIVHPEDRAAVDKAFRKCFEQCSPCAIEHRLLMPDGRIKFVEERWEDIRDEQGKPVRSIGTCQDITERKRAEEQMRKQASLIDLAHDAIIVRDLDDHIIFWNQGAERLYGWTADEVRGRRGTDFLYEDTAAFLKGRKALLERGKWNGELHQIKKNGDELVVSCHWTLVRNEQGEPVSFITINSDVTEQKKFEQQFLHAQRLESIGTLASGVAHDLNNILSPILMAAPLLRDEMPAAAREKLVSLVEQSAERGAAIVKQVLTFARGADGERVLVQPAYLLKEIMQIAEETFKKSISVRASYPENLSLIEGDPTQLHQVLLNLCVNARDAMPGGGTLALSAENLQIDEHYAAMTPGTKPGPHVLIKVSDTGTGIPAHLISKVFDPFFTTKEVGLGTGLGLSTALGIVKSHGGVLNVYSTPAGTTFNILLPASPDAHQPHTRDVESESPSGRGETILFVDDEPAICEAARMLLLEGGYKVLLAHDSPTALAIFALRSAEIDLVVTDLAMPNMNGLALARVLSKMDAEVRIIISTGQEDNFTADRIAELGIKATLPKPYSQSALLCLLDRVLHAQSEAKIA
ncbi:MAG: PAS domain S-box protein, partial [Verrucomicrobiota bacterium]